MMTAGGPRAHRQFGQFNIIRGDRFLNFALCTVQPAIEINLPVKGALLGVEDFGWALDKIRLAALYAKTKPGRWNVVSVLKFSTTRPIGEVVSLEPSLWKALHAIIAWERVLLADEKTFAIPVLNSFHSDPATCRSWASWSSRGG
jgi:hypothetical protein